MAFVAIKVQSWIKEFLNKRFCRVKLKTINLTIILLLAQSLKELN